MNATQELIDRVLRIIDDTYEHDENGRRCGDEGVSDGCDVLEELLIIEPLVIRAAIENDCLPTGYGEVTESIIS